MPEIDSDIQGFSAEQQARAEKHESQRRRSYALLQEAKTRAAAKSGYNSARTRKQMSNECKRRSGGKIIPYDWQLDVAECLLLGVDCELIAPTGAGKTIPFALPLMAESSMKQKKTMVILSPLNALEDDQARRFQELGLPAVAVNGQTYTADMRKDILARKYRAIFTSPNMCLQHEEFRAIVSSPAFARKNVGYIVDEGHCITQWGDKFREEYMQLGTIRAFSTNVPFLVTSATMTPDDLVEIRKSVHIEKSKVFHLNLGNDRPNIHWNVRYMKAGKSDLDALELLLPEPADPGKETLKRAIVFFDNIMVSMEAERWFKERLPTHLRSRVACYSAQRGKNSKVNALRKFQKGQHDILFATEAAGMGCDLADIEVVVQFMAPKSLSVWLQRAGRAGRKRGSKAAAYLLVQPTVFQEKGKKKRLEGEDVQYMKEIEEGLRKWIEANECRRDVADEYFFNPVVREGQFASHALEKWRVDAWYAHFSECSFGVQGVMPDVVLTAFASNARWRALEDIENPAAGWVWLEDHGAEVLALLKTLDDDVGAEKESEKRARREEKIAETARRNAEKKEAARVAREADKQRKIAERERQPAGTATKTIARAQDGCAGAR
ncbi:P-loop containing nucleoside triphosphate hydrolase protein [Auriscalpium vulgare]|uniref:P-loop containing nucleoside triphosphate hydrolase protein n=1 Tax=Auriscalpium vulgare TaxID=40419 RepID=A0ACB8RJT4_9AGAM|nr:P-loop containing nucleoside triphosphate hydrolase protein [Auriscalpium vulgare]